MFDHLFSPLVLGKITIPNRICFLAHRTNFAQKNRLTERHIAYYQRRARGGCGLVTVGELSIHPNDQPWQTMIKAYEPEVVNDYRKLTAAVHEFEIPIFAQLCHHGFQSNGAITRHAIWGPSAISDIVFGETAKTMEKEDMSVIVEAFSRASALAREGGFDGIEIDMGPESLLRQYLSPLSNLRQDEYGGSFQNRMHLPLEVIGGILNSVGDDFTVGIRLCGDEKFWGAITLDESRQFAQQFETTGKIDFINVSVGTYYNLHLVLPSMHTPFGFTLEAAEEIRKSVNIPVIASHHIAFPQMAEDIVRESRADAVGLVRTLICDPDAPNKAQEGKLREVRYCAKDNQGCIGRINQSRTLGCIQNPEVGYENCELRIADGGLTYANIPKTRKRVLVVGAGPAGLEAARIAGERGHDVLLYEKAEVPGGQVNLIRERPGRRRMGEIIRYLHHMLEKRNVPIITGVRVTPEVVLKVNPDAVIVATGSKPKEKPVPGEYGPPTVLNVWQVIEGSYPVGEKVLFIDESGGHHATATVELLADQRKKVDMVTSDLFIGIGLAPLGDLYLTRQRLLQKGVTFTTDVIIDRIDGNRVSARHIYTNESVRFDGYDTIVLDMGNRVEDRLYRQLKGQVRELYRVGDCVAPRGIDMAILEGRRAGERV